jgi:AbrB family looped-hinge helix DNA binding protein
LKGSSKPAPSSRGGRVTETGRLSLPADVRRQVGLEKGGAVRIEVVDGVIHIRTMQDVMNKVRALAQSTGFAEGVSVDGFLSWREEERRRETSGDKLK